MTSLRAEAVDEPCLSDGYSTNVVDVGVNSAASVQWTGESHTRRAAVKELRAHESAETVTTAATTSTQRRSTASREGARVSRQSYSVSRPRASHSVSRPRASPSLSRRVASVQGSPPPGAWRLSASSGGSPRSAPEAGRTISAGGVATKKGKRRRYVDTATISSRWKAVLLAVLLLELGGALFLFLRSREQEISAVDARNEERLRSTLLEFGQHMITRLDNAEKQIEQWRKVVPLVTSAQHFDDLFNRPVLETTLLYAPRVRHEDRATFEAEAYDDLGAFLNSTQVPRNISAHVLDAHGNTTLVARGVQPEYYPTQYVAPPLPASRYMGDLLSHPWRGQLLEKTLQTPDTVVLTPVGVSSYLDRSRFSTFGAIVVDPSNSSKVLGVLTSIVYWQMFIRQDLAVGTRGPVELSVYDVTDDMGSQLGCRFPLVSCGTQHGSGEWAPVSDNQFTCNDAASPEQLVPEGAISMDIEVSSRTFKLIVAKAEGFDEEADEVQFIVGSAFLAVAIAMVAAVVLNGWIVVRHLQRAAKASEQYVAELTKAEEKSREAAEHRDQFLAFLSHELRNPLFGLEGTIDEGVEQLRLCTSEDARQALDDSFATLRECTHQIERTLNTVANVQNMTTGKIVLNEAPFRIGVVLDELRQQFEAAAFEKSVRLQFEVDAHVPGVVVGDVQRVMEVLTRLVENAVRYTREGSIVLCRVTLGDTAVRRTIKPQRLCDATVVPISKSYEHSYEPSRSESVASSDHSAEVTPISFVVRDRGPGMTRSQIKRALQPYTRERIAKASRNHGSNLGLPIVKLLCEQMGGSLSVRSGRHKGCEFTATVRLCKGNPRDAEEAVLSIIYSDASGSPSRRPPAHDAPLARAGVAMTTCLDAFAGRLLVVDDQRVNRRLVSRLLGSVMPTATVEMAEDGQEAVRKVLEAAAEGAPFNCVFMDIQMPIMTGVEATAQLRKEGFTLPIIAVTGGTLEEEVASYLACGMVDVIHKPCKKSDFVAKLKQHWMSIAHEPFWERESADM